MRSFLGWRAKSEGKEERRARRRARAEAVTVSRYSSRRLRWETACLSTRLLLSVHTWTLTRPPSSSSLWTCSRRCHGNVFTKLLQTMKAGLEASSRSKRPTSEPGADWSSPGTTTVPRRSRQGGHRCSSPRQGGHIAPPPDSSDSLEAPNRSGDHLRQPGGGAGGSPSAG